LPKSFLFAICLAVALPQPILCSESVNSSPLPLTLDILSSKTISGTAGDFVDVLGQITNTGSRPISDITTYLSLVDNANKLPVDLEDWSAERGLHVGTIEAGQTLPLNWKIHLVKAGDYSLIIVADAPISNKPQVSEMVHFSVDPKRNLNPGQVLPVALGVPILLLIIMGVMNYLHRLRLV
jgi:hypothetical protein